MTLQVPACRGDTNLYPGITVARVMCRAGQALSELIAAFG